MQTSTSGTDSLVVFHNSQGLVGRGTLMHLTRNQAVFEVYNPYSIVQLSEVLQDVKVLRGERTIYSGRAVVSNLLPTGLMLIVSATLVDPWSDLADLSLGGEIRDEVVDFVREWETTHTLHPSYQLAVGNIRSFLAELSGWLQQSEVAVGVAGNSAVPEREREFVEEVADPLEPKIEELFTRFEESAALVPDDEVEVHKAFARRDIHPLMLCAPFVHRAYTKPLGYAGDYQMVNMILGDPLDGTNAYAKIVNAISLKSGTGVAHRNRIGTLTEYLEQEARRVNDGEGRPLKVLNVGCGPAREVENFIRDESRSERCDLNLLDFNEETIAFARKRLVETAKKAHRDVELHFIHKSIHQLLKEASGRRGSVEPAYDFVYCAGLFDYLGDRICKKLLTLFYRWTYPRGLVVATNVHTSNPIRYLMEHLMEWYLVLRNEASLSAIAPDGGVKKVFTDSSGVNVFLEIRKEGELQ